MTVPVPTLQYQLDPAQCLIVTRVFGVRMVQNGVTSVHTVTEHQAIQTDRHAFPAAQKENAETASRYQNALAAAPRCFRLRQMDQESVENARQIAEFVLKLVLGNVMNAVLDILVNQITLVQHAVYKIVRNVTVDIALVAKLATV